MDEKKIKEEENYDFIYKDYFEAEKGDTDDFVFAPITQDKKQSEK